MAEITVWVNGRQKRVSGMTRSTTCRDVVTLLLKDHLKTDEVLPSYSHCFSLFERWRGCERVISPRTRLYKLWKAWDHEQKNVRFTLKRSTSGEPRPEEIGDELIGQDAKKSVSKASKHPSRKGPILVEDTSSKRVRSSTVRPLKVRNKSHRKSVDSSVRQKDRHPESRNRNLSESAEDLETLVQTVVKQSKRLQKLLEKIQEIDAEIEFYETKAHILRVEEKGKNYVQEAYLSRLERDNSQSEDTDDNVCELVTNGCSDLETYISLYENLLDVETRLSAKRGTIAELTENIERTRFHRTDDRMTFETSKGGDSPENHSMTYDELVNHYNVPLGTDDEKYLADHQREIGLVRAHLEWYTDVCIAQRSEITTMHHRLASAETVYNDKHHWLDILVTELERIERNSLLDTACFLDTDTGAEPKSHIRETVTEALETVTEECETNDQGESKLDDEHDSGICMSPDETQKLKNRISVDNDSSSDTGLSSLHSQEDTEHSPFVTETLV